MSLDKIGSVQASAALPFFVLILGLGIGRLLHNRHLGLKIGRMLLLRSKVCEWTTRLISSLQKEMDLKRKLFLTIG
jgi:hypothetical protein